MSGKNFYSFFAIFVLGVIFLATSVQKTLAQDEDLLSEFRALEGCWEVEAVETNSINEIFKQSGVITIRPILDGAAIEILKHFEVTEATGLYAGISKTRKFKEELSFDPKTRLVTRLFASPQSPAPTPQNVAISEDGRTIFGTFMFYHPRRKITLFGEETITIVSLDEVSLINKIRDVFGEYRETYHSTWSRLGNDFTSCLSTTP